MNRAQFWIRVEGHVQGVGFRAHVRELGEGLGLDGEVWNTRDRAVECRVSGPSDLVEEFLIKLRNGPGRVDRVVTQPDNLPVGSGFSIEATR